VITRIRDAQGWALTIEDDAQGEDSQEESAQWVMVNRRAKKLRAKKKTPSLPRKTPSFFLGSDLTYSYKSWSSDEDEPVHLQPPNVEQQLPPQDWLDLGQHLPNLLPPSSASGFNTPPSTLSSSGSSLPPAGAEFLSPGLQDPDLQPGTPEAPCKSGTGPAVRVDQAIRQQLDDFAFSPSPVKASPLK
jgi:hypothetical protein